MSGGRKIDDHSFWAGKGEHGSVLPAGGHKLKEEHSAEGEGHEPHYEDTTEAIREVQGQGDRKIKSKPMKPGYRY